MIKLKSVVVHKIPEKINATIYNWLKDYNVQVIKTNIKNFYIK